MENGVKIKRGGRVALPVVICFVVLLLAVGSVFFPGVNLFPPYADGCDLTIGSEFADTATGRETVAEAVKSVTGAEFSFAAGTVLDRDREIIVLTFKRDEMNRDRAEAIVSALNASAFAAENGKEYSLETFAGYGGENIGLVAAGGGIALAVFAAAVFLILLVSEGMRGSSKTGARAALCAVFAMLVSAGATLLVNTLCGFRFTPEFLAGGLVAALFAAVCFIAVVNASRKFLGEKDADRVTAVAAAISDLRFFHGFVFGAGLAAGLALGGVGAALANPSLLTAGVCLVVGTLVALLSVRLAFAPAWAVWQKTADDQNPAFLKKAGFEKRLVVKKSKASAAKSSAKGGAGGKNKKKKNKTKK